MRSGGGGQNDGLGVGDASLRLIYGGDVAAVDTSNVPGFKQFFLDSSRSPPNNTVEGQALRNLAAVGPKHPALQHGGR